MSDKIKIYTINLLWLNPGGHLNSGNDKMANVGTIYENVLPCTMGSLYYEEMSIIVSCSYYFAFALR